MSAMEKKEEILIEINKPFLVGPAQFDQERLICLDAEKYRTKKSKCKK